MNDNEEPVSTAKNCADSIGNSNQKVLNNNSLAVNIEESSAVTSNDTERDSHQEFSKNMNNKSEKEGSTFCTKELLSTENISMDLQCEDSCLQFKHPCQHQNRQSLKAIDGVVFCGNEGNKSNHTNSPEIESSLIDRSAASEKNQNDIAFISKTDAEIQPGKPQSMSNVFNTTSPDEISLIEKERHKTLLQNPDIPKINQSNDELIMAISDNSIVISNSNAIPQSDSIVSSNFSLSQLQQYISDNDDDDDDSVMQQVTSTPLQYRESNQQMEDSDDDSDSTSSSSTSILISDSSSDSESEDEYENINKQVIKPIKAKGEMDLKDLPPIEDLTITVPEEECIPIGKIYQIVDQLVIVQANKDTPAYDLDTVLFTQGGRPLGKVFDVMGPVTEPYYCIRFNSRDHIKEKNIALDQTVYAAPKTKYSKFVFLAQLMQLKGSDASWENDIEPPEIYLDYSDDEQEQRAKKKFYRNRKAANKTDSDPDEPARKRHSAYVKRMNARNLRLTAARGGANSNKSKTENRNNLWQPNLPSPLGATPPRARAPCHQMYGRPPVFDVRVPPPNSPHGPRGPQSPVFPGPSTSSRSQGPLPFPPPGCSFFPRPVSSPGPSPFPQHMASPGPPPFPQHIASPGPPPFLRPSSLPFSQPGTALRPAVFPRTSAASAASMFPRPSGRDPRIPTFSTPQLQSNQGFRPDSPGWNTSFQKSDDPWLNPFRSPPVRNTPPPFGPFQYSMGPYPGPFPVRTNPPQGPQANFPSPSPRSGQMNIRGNPPRLNFNPSMPPPSPNRPQN